MVSECDGLWSEGNEDEIEELRSSDYVMCCKAITEQLITYYIIIFNLPFYKTTQSHFSFSHVNWGHSRPCVGAIIALKWLSFAKIIYSLSVFLLFCPFFLLFPLFGV